jgi:hypothetical protein
MIPKASQAIGHLITRIAQDLIPKAADAYMATDLGYLAALMSIIGQDYDRAADVLVTEHEAICALLLEAAAVLDDGGLKARIAAALDLRSPSLRVPDLNARADVTVKLLIDVHAAVESAGDAGSVWAEPVNLKIWDFLERFAANRAYDVAF